MSAADIIIGAAWVWQSPVGVARPYADVPYGAAWPGWRRLGLTSAALTANLERTRTNKMVQQALGKVGTVITGETLTLETSLAEFTLENLSLSWPGYLTVSPAEVGRVGYERLQGGGKVCLATLQWGFEGLFQNEDCSVQFPLRFYCIGEAEMGGQITFGKEDQTGIPFRVEASYELERPAGRQLYEWYKITAPALAA